MKNNFFIICAAVLLVTACNNNKNNFDASGTFEADETIIASEGSGALKQFDVQEGRNLAAGTVIGYIDSTQLYLKKKQLLAQITALLGKKPDVAAQLASLQEQLKATEKEQKRFTSLVKANAATQKQLDDLDAQVAVLKKQIDAQNSSLGITSQGINKDVIPLQIQIEQLNDQLEKYKLINPSEGTVLSKYAEVNEITAPGKPLYKIANISSLFLRAYITGNQLPQIKLNQKVKVMTDLGDGKSKESEGVITWISDKSEFTPKTIQTKDERANLVNAIKIKVNNDGGLKIGMYGEVKFN